MMSNADIGLVAASTVDRSIVAINLCQMRFGVVRYNPGASAQHRLPRSLPRNKAFTFRFERHNTSRLPARAVVNYPDAKPHV